MTRRLDPENFYQADAFRSGLSQVMLDEGAAFAYAMLDTIDHTLVLSESPRLAGLVELANFSSILGNLLAAGIVKASNGAFQRAGPHKYQDLRASGVDPSVEHIEIKVALEKNAPKGHLAKPGYYLVCRYVLANELGEYLFGERGDVAWIWELRFGRLADHHFNLSNTPGDSGKTAVVNREGMEQLKIVYVDRARCPYSARSKYVRELAHIAPSPLLKDRLPDSPG